MHYRGDMMQNQRHKSDGFAFLDVPLSDAFPVIYFHHEQKYMDRRSMHTHHSFELGLCVEGGGLFFADSRAESFQEGDVSFIFPDQPHIAQSPDEVPSHWYFITADIDRLLIDEPLLMGELMLSKGRLPYILRPGQDGDIAPLMRCLLHELEQSGPQMRLVVKALFLSLTVKLLRLRTELEPQTLPADGCAAVSTALNYISVHYRQETTIPELASLCHLSESHFRTLFKTATGLSPSRYLALIRMKMAKTLLKTTSLSITDVCDSVGYGSLSAFNRAFREQFGLSPAAYRKK